MSMFGRHPFLYFVLISFMVGLLAGGCAGTVVGSPNIVTRQMDFSNFTEVEVGGTFEAGISRADAHGVSITANENLFDYIEISQRGSTLIIRPRPRLALIRTTLKADITMPELKGLELSGSSKGKISGFSSSNPLNLEVSGASSLEIDRVKSGDAGFLVSGASRASGSIETARARFEVSGASSMELNGSGADINLEVSGASRLNLRDFRAGQATVDISGASTATVNASRVEGEVNGASRLNYVGNPTLGRMDVSGASSISQVE